LPVVNLWEIGWLGWDSRAVEHVLVRVHRDWRLAHILWLQRSLIHHFLELERTGCDGGRTLGRVTAGLVVLVSVEIRDIWDNWVAVGQVSLVIPPVEHPVLDLWVIGLCHEALLELLSHSARLDKVLC